MTRQTLEKVTYDFLGSGLSGFVRLLLALAGFLLVRAYNSIEESAARIAHRLGALEVTLAEIRADSKQLRTDVNRVEAVEIGHVGLIPRMQSQIETLQECCAESRGRKVR